MPLYEYKCEKCGEVFEVRQKFSDEPVTVHEKCGGAVERLISAPTFQFKGTGWYVTDYAKGSGAPSKKDSQSSSTTETAGAAKTDSKSSESKPASSDTSTKS